jgi:hypothetical protein
MYPSSERGSQDNLRQSQQSDDSEFADFRSPAVQRDGNDRRPRPLRQDPSGLVEPFTVDEADLEADASALWYRFQSSARSFFCRRGSDARLRAWFFMRKPWLSRHCGRKLRISRCIIYLIVGCLCFLCVPLPSKCFLSSSRLLTSFVAA